MVGCQLGIMFMFLCWCRFNKYNFYNRDADLNLILLEHWNFHEAYNDLKIWYKIFILGFGCKFSKKLIHNTNKQNLVKTTLVRNKCVYVCQTLFVDCNPCVWNTVTMAKETTRAKARITQNFITSPWKYNSYFFYIYAQTQQIFGNIS